MVNRSEYTTNRAEKKHPGKAWTVSRIYVCRGLLPSEPASTDCAGAFCRKPIALLWDVYFSSKPALHPFSGPPALRARPGGAQGRRLLLLGEGKVKHSVPPKGGCRAAAGGTPLKGWRVGLDKNKIYQSSPKDLQKQKSSPGQKAEGAVFGSEPRRGAAAGRGKMPPASGGQAGQG